MENKEPRRDLTAEMSWAADNDDLKGLRDAFARGADVHAWDDAALKLAAEEGRLPVVKCLVEHGANVRADNDQPLRAAACMGHFDVVQFMAEQTFDPNIWRGTERARIEAEVASLSASLLNFCEPLVGGERMRPWKGHRAAPSIEIVKDVAQQTIRFLEDEKKHPGLAEERAEMHRRAELSGARRVGGETQLTDSSSQSEETARVGAREKFKGVLQVVVLGVKTACLWAAESIDLYVLPRLKEATVAIEAKPKPSTKKFIL